MFGWCVWRKERVDLFTYTPRGESPRICGTTPGLFPSTQTIGSASSFQRARQQERARTRQEPCPSTSTSYRIVPIARWGSVNHLRDAGTVPASSHEQRASVVNAHGSRLHVLRPMDSLLLAV